MFFGEALEELKKGQRLYRKNSEWRYCFIFLVHGSTFEVNRAPLNQFYEGGTKVNYRHHIDKRFDDGTIGPWHPTHDDLLANDWDISD